MNAPVRFAYANARMHALSRDLWDERQIARVGAAPQLGLALGSGDFAALYPPLVRWYATLLKSCPPARPALLALFTRHEVENLKLRWRAAVRERQVPGRLWRPLGPLATIQYEAAPGGLAALVAGLQRTPYAQLTAETLRSHDQDLQAAELAIDGWVTARLHAAAGATPPCESPARELLWWLVRERDLDLLRRGAAGYRLEPAFAAGLTTVLKGEQARAQLIALAAWRPSAGPLGPLLPAAVRRAVGLPRDWEQAMFAVHEKRVADCRRARVRYPFQLAPTIAALLLREEQMRVVSRLAARLSAPAGGHDDRPNARAA